MNKMPEDNIYRGKILPEHLYDFLEEHGGKGTALKFLKDVFTRYEEFGADKDWLRHALSGWYNFNLALWDLRVSTPGLSGVNRELWKRLQLKANELKIKVRQ